MKNKSAIFRLFMYQKAMERLLEKKVTNTYSEKIAEEVGSSSAQVRKDFSIFDISGKKRGGYDVKNTLKQISNIIQSSDDKKLIIVGVGKIGAALLSYKKFKKEKIKIIAGFDKEAEKINKIDEIKKLKIPIYPMTELSNFVKTHNPSVAILTVPAANARQVANKLAKVGITGILNFSAIELGLPQDKIVVHSVDLRVTLKNLFFHVENISS